MSPFNVHRSSAIGALLLGGAVLFSAGCRDKHMVFWPKSTEPFQEVRVPQPEPVAEQTPLAAEEAPAAKDSATGGFPEERTGDSDARLEARLVPELPPVYFEHDSSGLNTSIRAALLQHIEFLRRNGDVAVILRGHTDTSGTDEYNISLGSRRAQAVRDFLIESGITAPRVETVSYGEGLPLIETPDEKNERRNRRVEFFLYEP